MIDKDKIKTAQELTKNVTSNMTIKEKVIYKANQKTTWIAIASLGYLIFTQNWGGVTLEVIEIIKTIGVN